MNDCTHILPLQDSLDLYVNKHLSGGGFLTALLENNLVETFARADANNSTMIREYIEHLYWCMPGNCWGSPQKVNDWLNER